MGILPMLGGVRGEEGGGCGGGDEEEGVEVLAEAVKEAAGR